MNPSSTSSEVEWSAFGGPSVAAASSSLERGANTSAAPSFFSFSASTPPSVTSPPPTNNLSARGAAVFSTLHSNTHRTSEGHSPSENSFTSAGAPRPPPAAKRTTSSAMPGATASSAPPTAFAFGKPSSTAVAAPTSAFTPGPPSSFGVTGYNESAVSSVFLPAGGAVPQGLQRGRGEADHQSPSSSPSSRISLERGGQNSRIEKRQRSESWRHVNRTNPNERHAKAPWHSKNDQQDIQSGEEPLSEGHQSPESKRHHQRFIASSPSLSYDKGYTSTTLRRTPPSELCLNAKFFQCFLTRLGSDQKPEKEQSSEYMRNVFFTTIGVLSVTCDLGDFIAQLSQVWDTTAKCVDLVAFPKGILISCFFLGTWLNCMVTALENHKVKFSHQTDPRIPELLEVFREFPEETFQDACAIANQLNELTYKLFSDSCSAELPCSLLPLLSHRAHSVFQLLGACDPLSFSTTFFAEQPQVKLTLLRNALRKRMIVAGVDKDMFAQSSEGEKPLLFSMAYLLCACCDSLKEGELKRYADSFHQRFPTATLERCRFHYVEATMILLSSLTVERVEEAVQHLASALVLCGHDESEQNNRRILVLKLLASQLALGKVYQPCDGEDIELWQPPELQDVMVAVRAANLPLLDAALQQFSTFYVQTGIYNVLQFLRSRIRLLMVIKFYMLFPRGKEVHQLSISDMIDYYHLPYSVVTGSTMWLMPLLLEKKISGYINLEQGYLIVAKASPFPEYSSCDLSVC